MKVSDETRVDLSMLKELREIMLHVIAYFVTGNFAQ